MLGKRMSNKTLSDIPCIISDWTRYILDLELNTCVIFFNIFFSFQTKMGLSNAYNTLKCHFMYTSPLQWYITCSNLKAHFYNDCAWLPMVGNINSIILPELLSAHEWVTRRYIYILGKSTRHSGEMHQVCKKCSVIHPGWHYQPCNTKHHFDMLWNKHSISLHARLMPHLLTC